VYDWKIELKYFELELLIQKFDIQVFVDFLKFGRTSLNRMFELNSQR